MKGSQGTSSIVPWIGKHNQGKVHFMLIQCQSCNSKYRLNLERIPSRRSFIKCKKCNGPIYIDPREDGTQEDDAGPDLQNPADSQRGGAPEDATDGLAPVACTN